MKTKLLIEHFAGDTMKVVAFQLDDMFEKDRLQTDEINSLVKNRITQTALVQKASTTRPKPSKKFEKNYHSGNLYTRTKSVHEKNLADRLAVIELCFKQMQSCDGITKKDFLTLCESYVRVHFDDGVDVGDSLPEKP